MNQTVPTITPHQARDLCTANVGALLLDVRTPPEFTARRAVGAKNIPLDTLESSLAALPKEATVLLLCEKGGRASQAASKLKERGFANVHVVEGGTAAWVAGGLPVEGSGRKTIGIERQVRIGAGSLVLTGILLGLLLHPGFFGLSAFVGAGLVFAGVTDWCGMGLLLAKAPWNR